MRKIIVILLTLITSLTVVGQTFEGKISYSNIYKSKKWMLSDEKLNALMGNKQDYYIKNGDYKSITNGSWIQYTQYINKENRIYTKLYDVNVVYWNDASVQEDEVYKVEVHKNVIEVLGYRCDEVVMTCKSGIQKYYFNSVAAVDYKLYTNHKFGNWFDFIQNSHALPLKMILETDKLSVVSIATEIKEMKLDNKGFELPPNAKIKKNPY